MHIKKKSSIKIDKLFSIIYLVSFALTLAGNWTLIEFASHIELDHEPMIMIMIIYIIQHVLKEINTKSNVLVLRQSLYIQSIIAAIYFDVLFLHFFFTLYIQAIISAIYFNVFFLHFFFTLYIQAKVPAIYFDVFFLNLFFTLYFQAKISAIYFDAFFLHFFFTLYIQATISAIYFNVFFLHFFFTLYIQVIISAIHFDVFFLQFSGLSQLLLVNLILFKTVLVFSTSFHTIQQKDVMHFQPFTLVWVSIK